MPITGSVNDSTNVLTTKIIFGEERDPGYIYTDFSTGKTYGPGVPFEMPVVSLDYYISHQNDWEKQDPPHGNCFPGYFLVENKNGELVNMYRGTDLGFGGYVYANPGMYYDAVTLDVRSMHPNSIIQLIIFGEKYTARFEDLVNLRALIKHKNYAAAGDMFGGALKPYLNNDKDAKALSNALKTAINSVYGLTSASFDNQFRDPRNVNNIVALRGALFMRTLQEEVESQGFTVIHIKTDSIKIHKPTKEIIDYCMKRANDFGYEFEVEHTWKKLCLVNHSVFVGMHGSDDPESPGEWETTGTQFMVPYVRKTLFTHEPIDFFDMCETKQVQNAMYLDMNEQLGDDSDLQKELKKTIKEWGRESVQAAAIQGEISKHHNLRFVGRVGLFTPVLPGCGGGILLSKNNVGNLGAVSGTKGYRWLEASEVKDLGKEDVIDKSYYTKLCDAAIDSINRFGDFNEFAAS